MFINKFRPINVENSEGMKIRQNIFLSCNQYMRCQRRKKTRMTREQEMFRLFVVVASLTEGEGHR